MAASRIQTLEEKWRAKDVLARLHAARADRGVTGEEVAKLIEEFIDVLQLSPQVFMERCRISSSTYYRWLKGDRPPAHRLERLNSFIEQETPAERARDSIISGDRRLTLRPLEQILDRQIRCKRCWVIKNSLPFRAADPGIVMSTIFDFLAQTDNDVSFHCVFYAPAEDDDSPISPHAGLESFRKFKYKFREFCQNSTPDAVSRLHGWKISDDGLAYRLGLIDNFLGINILEYDRKKTRDLSNLANRDVDIFFEIPLAVYQADNHLKLTGDEEFRWHELAPEKASSYWQSKRDILIKLADGGFDKSEGVTEIMTADKEFDDFVPRRY